MKTTDLFEYKVESVAGNGLGWWEFQVEPKPMQLIERMCMGAPEGEEGKYYIVYSEEVEESEVLFVEELTEQEFDKWNDGKNNFLTVESDYLDDEYGA